MVEGHDVVARHGRVSSFVYVVFSSSQYQSVPIWYCTLVQALQNARPAEVLCIR